MPLQCCEGGGRGDIRGPWLLTIDGPAKYGGGGGIAIKSVSPTISVRVYRSVDVESLVLGVYLQIKMIEALIK